MDLYNLKLAKLPSASKGLEPIFTSTPAASKNEARFKSGQKQLKNNHLASLA